MMNDILIEMEKLNALLVSAYHLDLYSYEVNIERALLLLGGYHTWPI